MRNAQLPLSHADITSLQSAGYADRMTSLGRSLLRLAGAAVKSLAARTPGTQHRGEAGVDFPERTSRQPRPGKTPRRAPALSYDPEPGRTADPGEIVWTWVPYEDDPSQGKDRPVLIIGRTRGSLLALMLTSRDRNNALSRHDGYIDIGSGPWDRKGRPSEVYLERVLTVDPGDVRRVGATLDRSTYKRVTAALERASGK